MKFTDEEVAVMIRWADVDVDGPNENEFFVVISSHIVQVFSTVHEIFNIVFSSSAQHKHINAEIHGAGLSRARLRFEDD